MKNFIDSSDDEQEVKVLENIQTSDYTRYLIDTLEIKDIQSGENFKEKLGLLLHHLTDRVFRNSIINDVYKNIKSEKLGLKSQLYNESLANVKIAFNKKLDQLFEAVDFKDKDYIQLFNFLFNSNINLPEAAKLKGGVRLDDIRKMLLKELRDSEVNLGFLNHDPFILKLENEGNAGEILAFSKIINRSNKDKLKFLTYQQTDNYSLSSIYNVPKSNLKIFTDTHVLHYGTGNVQSEIFGFGAYKGLLSNIPIDSIGSFIKCIFTLINGGKPINMPQVEGEENYNTFAEQLTHLLFITEMQRNTATLCTAPMFLELIEKDLKKHIDMFPMAMKDAVSHARGVVHSYGTALLFNTHFMDFDIKNVKPAAPLLMAEGGTFVAWITEIIGNNFNYICQLFNTLSSGNYLLGAEEADISLGELNQFVTDISKINHFPEDLFNSLVKPLQNNLGDLTAYCLNKKIVSERDIDKTIKLSKAKLLEKFIKIKNEASIKAVADINKIYNDFIKHSNQVKIFLLTVTKESDKDLYNIVHDCLNILSKKIKHWYNIEALPGIKLKASDEFKGYKKDLVFDTHIIKEKNIEEAGEFYKGKFKGEIKGEIKLVKTLLKKHFKEDEIEKDLTLLSKKRCPDKFEEYFKYIQNHIDETESQIMSGMDIEYDMGFS